MAVKMTDKQKAFVQEYLIDLNATQAAIRAGYSRKNASRIAIELLNKTHVSKALGAAMKKRQERTEITQDMIVRELAKVAFAKYDEDNVQIGLIKTSDKIKALELLGKHLGMFTDKVELSGEVNTNADKLDKILEQLNE